MFAIETSRLISRKTQHKDTLSSGENQDGGVVGANTDDVLV